MVLLITWIEISLSSFEDKSYFRIMAVQLIIRFVEIQFNSIYIFNPAPPGSVVQVCRDNSIYSFHSLKQYNTLQNFTRELDLL